MVVTHAYYTNTYGGLVIAESDFTNLVKRADRKLQTVTGRVIIAEELPEAIKSLYQQAVCAQVEYTQTIGVEASLGVSDVTSARIGNFSYTAGKSNSANEAVTGLAPEALGYLSQAGLLYKGVAVRW